MNKAKTIFLALIMLTTSLAGCLGGETEILDEDGDGVADNLDLCPGTSVAAEPTEDELIDADGCNSYQFDDDGDDANNVADLCPMTPAGESVDNDGCSQSQLDDDADGVMKDKEL